MGPLFVEVLKELQQAALSSGLEERVELLKKKMNFFSRGINGKPCSQDSQAKDPSQFREEKKSWKAYIESLKKNPNGVEVFELEKLKKQIQKQVNCALGDKKNPGVLRKFYELYKKDADESLEELKEKYSSSLDRSYRTFHKKSEEIKKEIEFILNHKNYNLSEKVELFDYYFEKVPSSFMKF